MKERRDRSHLSFSCRSLITSLPLSFTYHVPSSTHNPFTSFIPFTPFGPGNAPPSAPNGR